MSDYEHHAPRVINKAKKQRNSVSEDALTKRQDRISFKNYIRNLDEGDNFTEETWVVERGILEEGEDFTTWNEIAAFADEDSANSERELHEDRQLDGEMFRVRLV